MKIGDYLLYRTQETTLNVSMDSRNYVLSCKCTNVRRRLYKDLTGKCTILVYHGLSMLLCACITSMIQSEVCVKSIAFEKMGAYLTKRRHCFT